MGLFDRNQDVQMSVVSMPPIPVVAYKFVGPYDSLGPCFDQLWRWVEANGVPAQRTIGVYWDNPDVTPANKLRSAACVEVPLGFQPPSFGSLPLSVEQLAGGEYATTRFVGPYEQLAAVWTAFTAKIERESGRTISEANPALEVYVNDPSDTPPDQLVTELYMPLD